MRAEAPSLYVVNDSTVCRSGAARREGEWVEKCVSWKTNRAVIIFIPVCSCFSEGSGQRGLALQVARKQEQGKIVFLY